jgi:hypothetical protein
MLSSKQLAILFGVCLFALAIFLLIVIGIRVGSDWGTFVPDLIIGVVGAAAIGGILFLAERRSESVRGRAEKVSATYDLLLEALSDLREVNSSQIDMKSFRRVWTRALQLYELVDDDQMGAWLEAERQLSLYWMKKTMDLVDALPAKPDAEDVFDAFSPYLKWSSEFGSNIRYWRTGKMTHAEMAEQSSEIQKLLTPSGQWRSSPMPWRGAPEPR